MAPDQIEDLYKALRDDPRLQKNWERNQPRIDRALEAILIVRTPREAATACLLACKLRFEPAAAACRLPALDNELISWARTQKQGGARLANIVEGKTPADEEARTAAACALMYYRNRAEGNDLVRLPWTHAGLTRLGAAAPDSVINPALKPTQAARAAEGLPRLAALINSPPAVEGDALRARLRDIPGLGPERADAVGCFAFRRSWPIVDEYLWQFLLRHQIIGPEAAKVSGYDCRRKLFEPHWQRLLAAGLGDPTELAATLYLWADEAQRYGFSYNLGEAT
ncbi:MAG: hypothetical protein ABIG11_08305 [bacterium]